jgi:hypothetical protein
MLLTIAAMAMPRYEAVAQDGPEVVFESEKIAVHVDDQYILVEGVYVFRNDSPAPHELPLFYPLPVDSLHLFPARVLVRQGGRTIQHRNRENGVSFTIDTPAEGTASVTVVYSQKCLDNSGCYILTSTSAWNRPLESAEFEITVAEGIELEWISYDAKPTDGVGSVRAYEFSRKDFLPEKDLCMRWRVAAGDEPKAE